MIKGRLVLKGTVKLMSPIVIGSGQADESDLDILKDHDGMPYIPATSFIGVILSGLREKFVTETGNIRAGEINQLDNLFGYANFGSEESKKSSIYCSDLRLNNVTPNLKIDIRDGIRINNKTGIVEAAAKYDYQTLQSGAEFKLNLTAEYDDNTKEFAEKVLLTVKNELEKENGIFRIGAKTMKGFGRVKLLNSSLQHYDYSDEANVINWLKRKDAKADEELKDALNKHFELKKCGFEIDAYFYLKNSLIVRSYTESPNMPDSVHIKSGGSYILPGTSLKGAIRARAERILNTINPEMAAKIIKELFGFAAEKCSGGNSDKKTRVPKNNSKKAKLTVEEYPLPSFTAEMQSRIKVDRFSGATIESALFDSMPLYNQFDFPADPKDLKNAVHVTLKIDNYMQHEAGLLLLALKDLWDGDLAVGGEKGVGRGVFEGIFAEISFDNEKIAITKKFADISDDKKKILQKFVTAVKEYKTVNK